MTKGSSLEVLPATSLAPSQSIGPPIADYWRPAQATTVPTRRLIDSSSSTSLSRALAPWVRPTLIGLALVGCYWETLLHLVGRWSREPEYSHGFFVIVFAAVLLWFRRAQIPVGEWPSSGWGFLLIAVGIAGRFIAAYSFYPLIGAAAIIPTLFGIALLAGGWPAVRWSWPSIVFLAFMIPLPGFVSDSLSHPLQRIATLCSAYLLQMAGVPLVDEGNVILLSHGKIGVIEACSGLRMLILFFAVSTAVAMLVERRPWERALLIVSAIPIALVVNILRITATGMVHEWIGPKPADLVFHDLAGWLMGPAALGLLCLELKLFDRAFVEDVRGPLAVAITRRGAS